MRYFIICRGLYPGSRPWVLAETPDEAYARDEADTWKTTIVVSRQEALGTPGYREAVLAWEAGDDSTYRRDMVREDAESALEASERGGNRAEIEAIDPGSHVLTFREFRDLAHQAGRSEAEVQEAYVQYLRLETAWAKAVEDAAG
ncbi:MAG: hypothetical protein HY658_05160 [Actinobacteria bacterium]|nr:hypothetical protein [Actinomycetota bacterium]